MRFFIEKGAEILFILFSVILAEDNIGLLAQLTNMIGEEGVMKLISILAILLTGFLMLVIGGTDEIRDRLGNKTNVGSFVFLGILWMLFG